MGQFTESDAAGTCTLTFTSTDQGNNVRIYYSQATPTAGTNEFHACQQDFDANNGATACSAKANLTGVSAMMLTQTAPLQIALDNTTNAARHKSVIWIEDIPDFYAGWFYQTNHYIKPSVNNAGAHYYKCTSGCNSVSSTTTVTAEDEGATSATFDGSTTQYTFNLRNTDNISPGSLTITLGPLPGWGSGSRNRSVTDAVYNGTTTVTSATANFQSTDVGNSITTSTGGITIPANTYIATVTNSTTVVLSASVTGSASGAQATIGASKIQYGNNQIILPQSSSNSSPTNPKQLIFKNTTGSTCAPGGTQPVWAQDGVTTVTDGGCTWTPQGTAGYGGLTDIHDDASGHLVGKIGLTQQITDPGTGTNTITYVGGSAGAVHIDFASAPWPGGTFTITYQHTAAPTWCQTALCTTTVGSQTWTEAGTTTPTDQYYPSASAFGATAFIDYWGSDAYSAPEIAAAGTPPAAATNGTWFFNITSLVGSTATVTGENGSDATPDSSGAFTVFHDNTIPIANEITSINSAQAGASSVKMWIPSNSAAYLVAGQINTASHNLAIGGNGASLILSGDGVGNCTNLTDNGEIVMGANGLWLTGMLKISTSNSTADTMICHAHSGFGTIDFGSDIFFTANNKGNRTTAYGGPQSFSGRWQANASNFYRVMSVSQANGFVVNGGSIGNNPNWPGQFLTYCIAYSGGNTNDGFEPWLVFESCSNAIGPLNAGLNYMDSGGGADLNEAYNSDFLGGHTGGSGVSSGADSGFYLPIERAATFNLRGSWRVHEEEGASGKQTYYGNLWLRGNLSGANYTVQNTLMGGGAFGIIAESGTKLIADDSAFVNLVGGATCIEARGIIEARGNTCGQQSKATTLNPIVGYRLGYKQDESTCNGVSQTNASTSGNVFLQMDQMNGANANFVQQIAGAPMLDICSGNTSYYHVWNDLTQQQTLNIDTAGDVWSNILTENPTFIVTNSGTAGVKLMNPGCGGSAASPGYRGCSTSDIGRRFTLTVKCSNASCGTLTADSQYKTDETFLMPANTGVLSCNFIGRGASEWDQVGRCTANLPGLMGISGGGATATGSNAFRGTITGAAAASNVLTPGYTCPNDVTCSLDDITHGGGAVRTAQSATTLTFATTLSDTVDYSCGCR